MYLHSSAWMRENRSFRLQASLRMREDTLHSLEIDPRIGLKSIHFQRDLFLTNLFFTRSISNESLNLYFGCLNLYFGCVDLVF